MYLLQYINNILITKITIKGARDRQIINIRITLIRLKSNRTKYETLFIQHKSRTLLLTIDSNA